MNNLLTLIMNDPVYLTILVIISFAIIFSIVKKLFKFANPPKIFLEIDGLHNDCFLTSGYKYINVIDNFIKYTLEK